MMACCLLTFGTQLKNYSGTPGAVSIPLSVFLNSHNEKQLVIIQSKLSKLKNQNVLPSRYLKMKNWSNTKYKYTKTKQIQKHNIFKEFLLVSKSRTPGWAQMLYEEMQSFLSFPNKEQYIQFVTVPRIHMIPLKTL